MLSIRTLVSAVAISFVALAPTAMAASPFTPFGGATLVPDGASLVSDLSNTDPGDDYSGIDFSVPSDMTFADITELSTTFNVTDDDCAGGSPRYQVNVETPTGTKNIFVYLGPLPSFTDCPTGDIASGNLIGSLEPRYDLSQLGGSFYGTYAEALVLAGSYEVSGVQLVVDSGWAMPDQEQTVIVTNPVVTFDAPTSKDQCKDGGWQSFSSQAFKNQGDCVSFFASNGKAKGNP